MMADQEEVSVTDYSASNAVAIALTTDRPEFIKGARAALNERGSISVDDADRLLSILEGEMEARNRERDMLLAALRRLQELRTVADSFARQVEADIDALISAGAEWGRDSDVEEIRRIQADEPRRRIQP